MEIKIPEDLCKLSMADMEIAMQLERAGQEAMSKGNALLEQARGIQILVQERLYKALDLEPVAGDMMNFSEGKIERKVPTAPVAPVEPPANES